MTDYYKTLEVPESPFEVGNRVRITHSLQMDAHMLQAVGVIDRSEYDPDTGWTYALYLDDTSLYKSPNDKKHGVWFNEHDLEHEDGRPVRPHKYLGEICYRCGQDPFGPDSTAECPRDRSQAEIIEALVKGFQDRENRAIQAMQVLRDIRACLHPYTLQEGYQTNVMATGVGNSLRAIERFFNEDDSSTLKTLTIPILPIDPEAERLIDEYVANQPKRDSKPIK